MRETIVGLGLLCLLGGCQQAASGRLPGDSLRGQERYPLAWEAMADCIARSYRPEYRVTAMHDRSINHAELYLQPTASGRYVAAIVVHAITPTESVVSWRRFPTLVDSKIAERRARAIVDRCGRGA